MFADNDQISGRQLYCQFVLGILGAVLVFVPGKGRIYGIYGGISCLVVMGMMILYSILLVRVSPAYTHLEKHAGRVGTRLIGVLFLTYFIITAVFLVDLIKIVIDSYMATDVPDWIVHGGIVLGCGIAGIPQIQRRGRIAEFSFPLLMGGIVFMIMMAYIQNFENFEYMLPESYIDIDTFTADIYGIWSVFSCIGAVPFVLGKVRNHRYKSLVSGIFTIFFLLTGVLVLIQGCYGITQVQQRRYPVLSVMASIRAVGGFVFRMDPIWISLLLFLLLFSIGSTFFYANYVVKKTSLGIPWYVIYGLIYVLSLQNYGEWTIADLYKYASCFFFSPAIFFWNLFLGVKYRRWDKHMERG